MSAFVSVYARVHVLHVGDGVVVSRERAGEELSAVAQRGVHTREEDSGTNPRGQTLWKAFRKG